MNSSHFVTDTHALIWYLGGSQLLGANARAAFDRALGGNGEIQIPAIVIAELVMLAEKRRVVLDLETIIGALGKNPRFHLTPLTSEIALATRTLNLLNDIHDRLIVAQAKSDDAVLITRDEAIIASQLVPTVWLLSTLLSQLPKLPVQPHLLKKSQRLFRRPPVKVLLQTVAVP